MVELKYLLRETTFRGKTFKLALVSNTTAEPNMTPKKRKNERNKASI